jgi:hypothetical protein
VFRHGVERALKYGVQDRNSFPNGDKCDQRGQN